MERTIFAIFLIAGVVCLQIFLSKRVSKWPGLIIPIISFLFGFIYPLRLLYPLNMATLSEGVTAGFIVQLIIVWLLGNIPTMVFLAIYFGCREKQRRNKQLDKMNIQDLN